MTFFQSEKQNKTQRMIVLFFILICVLGVVLFGIWYVNRESEAKKADLERLLTESYNGIFTSMYNIETFNEEDFTIYRGLEILKTSYVHKNTSEIAEYLNEVLQTGNHITNVYLGLDPARIWSSSHKKIDKWNKNLEEDIIYYISSYPEVTFEVMLPFPEITYWKSQNETNRQNTILVYRTLINMLEAYPNVVIYYPGTEEWLINNPGNYEDTFVTNELLSQKLMLLTFCDRHYKITTDNADGYFERLNTLVMEDAKYPDLSEWCIVFMGDSIFGNYSGSFSIPGAVNGLSGAQVYNCAKGGTCATNDPETGLNFPTAVDAFINKNTDLLGEGDQFVLGLKEYLTDDHTGKKICFIVNYGLNDYFGGHAVSAQNQEEPSYENGMRLGIAKLQKAYPEAYILVLAPSYCYVFSEGTEIMSDTGGVLTDYVETALEVSKEMNVQCINLYSELGVNGENHLSYLADGTHFNEMGRFMLAEYIVKYMESNGK